MKSLKCAFLMMTGLLFAEEGCVELYDYDNRVSIFPLYVGYERIKADALYVGFDAWMADALPKGHWIGEAEFRLGNNYIFGGRDHVTPFVGVGVFNDFHKGHRKPAVLYGAFGLFYDHAFNSVFNLGIRFKGMVGGAHKKKHESWGSPVGGIDVGLPLTFRWGNERHWDFRLEPFDLYIHGSRHARNYIGVRGSLGYRF